MSGPADPYNLQRFIDAQQPVYMQVLTELRAGRKTEPLDLVYISADRRSGP